MSQVIIGGGGTSPVQGAVAQGAPGLLAWKVDASGAAIAITAASLPLPVGAATEATLAGVKGGTDKLPTLVSGRMPVDGSGATQPVSGTFWPATQPVSAAALPLPAGAAQEHATAASPASARLSDGTTYLGSTAQRLHVADGGVALSVAGPLTDTQLRASPVPVSGSFFQATQPVSMATNTPDVTDRAARALGVVAGITNALPAGTNKLGTVDVATAPATAKGVQGANGVPVQALIDAGRNQTNYYMALPVITTATDALVGLTGYKGGAAVAATASPPVVTAGKTYRITAVTITYVAVATAGSVQFTLRANLGGTVVIGSPAVVSWVVGGTAAVAGVTETVDIAVPDGFEFPAGAGIGVSMIGRGATQTAAAVGYGHIAIQGFEY